MSLVINFGERLVRIQRAMKDRDIDAMVITRDGGFRYVVGTNPTWRSAVVVPRDGLPELITMGYDIERLMDQTWLTNGRPWDLADPETFAHAVADSLVELGEPKTIALDLGSATNTGAISAGEYFHLTERLANSEFVNGMSLLNEIMLKKDPAEVEFLRRAAEISALGMMAAFSSIKAGVTEFHIAGAAEMEMRNAGNEFVWGITGTEVGSGYRQWYHHGLTTIASEKRLQYHDLVTIDVHPMYQNYLGDFSLNAVVGKPSRPQVKLAQAWRDVAETIFTELKPGVIVSDVAKAAKLKAEECGYGDYLAPFYGHGLGTDARMPHVITEKNNEVLAEDEVVEVLVQMNVPGVGGMRLELPTLITASGNERLNSFPVGLFTVDNGSWTQVDLGS